MKKILLMILLFSINSLAQIDTTALFPLDIGNYWEYRNNSGDIHYYQKVIGEETMPNGKTYKKILNFDFITKDSSHTYYRVEDNLRVFWYRGIELKIFDFTLSQGELWKAHDSVFGYSKVSLKRIEFHHLVQDSLLTIFKEYCSIDSTKVPPDTTIHFDVYSKFAKGIGITLYGNPIIRLTGLIIKGKKYGYVPIEEANEQTINNNYKMEISVYPNPFNNATNIVFNNPKEQQIKIRVINLLGEEVIKVRERQVKKGKEKIYLKMPESIATGIYFIIIKTQNKQYTKKIMYLK